MERFELVMAVFVLVVVILVVIVVVVMVVDLVPLRALAQPVSLKQIKADAALRGIPLVTQSRLSVMPIEKPAFDRILELGGIRLR